MDYIEKQIERLKQEKYAGEESADFLRDVGRLRRGEPYEYVLGYMTFLGARIDLSRRPMIPRPETAFWVERAIGELKEREKELGRPLRLAEVFAGSGAIASALLVHFPNAEVDVSELDPKLKEQIETNVKRNGGEGRARVITASVLEGLTKCIEPGDLCAVQGASEACDQAVGASTARGANERSNAEEHQVCRLYDAIFAVPPYIPYEELPELDPEMIEYEPHMAFLAHDDGHEFLTVLVKEGRKYLRDGGTLYVEADIDDNDYVRELVKGSEWSALEFWPDPYGATPNVILRK